MLSLVEVDDEDDDEEEEEEKEDDDDWARRLITFGVCARLEGITRPIYGNPTCVCMSFIRWMVNVQYTFVALSILRARVNRQYFY